MVNYLIVTCGDVVYQINMSISLAWYRIHAS
jgi:hypothetical protein